MQVAQLDAHLDREEVVAALGGHVGARPGGRGAFDHQSVLARDARIERERERRSVHPQRMAVFRGGQLVEELAVDLAESDDPPLLLQSLHVFHVNLVIEFQKLNSHRHNDVLEAVVAG